jgi:phosphoribosyl 1,2-cyclic phosphodiesterase/ActR/RegA family two-component response regulator
MFQMKTVLVIDDEPGFRQLVGEWLSSHGWRVLQAEDGETGLEVALREKPAVVLCDLLMPRGNGFKFCRSIKEQRARLPHTKVVVTTGSGYASDRLAAIEAGADAYFIKPLELAELPQMLDRLSAGHRAPSSQQRLGADGPEGTLIRFWGVRGSIPVPGPKTVGYGGNTSCVEVRADGELIVLDAGTGLRNLGISLDEEFKGRPLALTVLITHTHWDHIQGFPFFLPAYKQQNEVRIFGFEGARSGLERTLLSQMESPYFPISMREMPGHIHIRELDEMAFDIGRVRVRAEFLNHPGVCTGYRLFTSAGSIAYLPDVELFRRFREQLGGSELERAFAEEKDQKVADFIAGTDVLILDAQYDAAEYSEHVGWGHTCYEDAVDLAMKAGVRKLFLFHHDPTHDDVWVDSMVESARRMVAKAGSSMEVDAAREGAEILLPAAATEPISALEK